jgi:hypothetical protein
MYPFSIPLRVLIVTEKENKRQRIHISQKIRSKYKINMELAKTHESKASKSSSSSLEERPRRP